MAFIGSSLWVRRTFALAWLFGAPAAVAVLAQDWPLHTPRPPANLARVSRDLVFDAGGAEPLSMDIYRPVAARGPAPAVIFYTLYWPGEGPPARNESPWYRAWAHLAAANGIVAVLPDLRAEPGTGTAAAPARPLGDDFQRLTRHLTAHAAKYGIDPNRLALFAESGATWAALPAAQDRTQTAIKAVVLYYGAANTDTFRPDLPLLWVRAGLDSARTNSEILRQVSLALSQNAPVTLINYPTGHHGFEGRDNTPETRDVIAQTLDFIKRATGPR